MLCDVLPGSREMLCQDEQRATRTIKQGESNDATEREEDNHVTTPAVPIRDHRSDH